ncbi:MAG: hypothetical protein AB7F59_06350 [Bdellovibrionales bacterium]
MKLFLLLAGLLMFSAHASAAVCTAANPESEVQSIDIVNQTPDMLEYKLATRSGNSGPYTLQALYPTEYGILYGSMEDQSGNIVFVDSSQTMVAITSMMNPRDISLFMCGQQK